MSVLGGIGGIEFIGDDVIKYFLESIYFDNRKCKRTLK